MIWWEDIVGLTITLRYDAVTKNGYLTWQNALSAENGDFFRACYDGLFLNYNWTPQLLAYTQAMCVVLAKALQSHPCAFY